MTSEAWLWFGKGGRRRLAQFVEQLVEIVAARIMGRSGKRLAQGCGNAELVVREINADHFTIARLRRSVGAGCGKVHGEITIGSAMSFARVRIKS